MSVVYQVRTPDKSMVLTSGLTEEQAIDELINDYGVTLPEISDYFICRVTQESRTYRDINSDNVYCEFREHITDSMKIGDYRG